MEEKNIFGQNENLNAEQPNEQQQANSIESQPVSSVEQQPAQPQIPTEQPSVEAPASSNYEAPVAETPTYEATPVYEAPKAEPVQPQTQYVGGYSQPSAQQPQPTRPAAEDAAQRNPNAPMFEQGSVYAQPTRQEFYSQPQTTYSQPQQSYQQPQPSAQQPYSASYYQPQPKKKRGWLRGLIAAVVVLAILGGAVGTFAALYDVEFDGANISIIRRNFWEPRNGDLLEQPDGGDDSSIYAEPSALPSAAPTGRPAGENGPEMEINDSPVTQVDRVDSGKALSIQEIAAKSTDWTVGVVATSYYNSSYYFGYGGASSSSGTGIIMSSDGYIITNHHVVEGATDLTVILMDGTEYVAELVGSDERSDLAVLKIDAYGLSAAEFGDSDALMVGDPVVAIGNPLGLELMGTVTDGIVSAINRDVAVDERTMTLIQTNAAINSGNSGGPLINQYGQVIGINTLKMQDYSTTVEGLGFAIPTNTAKTIIDELIDKGYVSGYPAIGIRYQNVSESMAKYYSIPTGVLVGYVYPQSNAYAAGLQVNDVIVEAQGVEVATGAELMALLDEMRAGESFEMVVYHYDSKLYETITFELNDENDFVDGGALIGQQ